MAINNIWKIYAIQHVLDPGGAPVTTTIGGLSNTSMPMDAQVTRDVASGNIYATTGRIDFRSAGVTFTTTMIATALDLLGINGLCFPATSSDIVYVYLAKYNCDGPASGSVHRRYALTKGMIFPNSMSVDHQGNLTLNATITAVYDGTNVPVTVVDNVALPAIANVDDQWTMSEKCLINNVEFINKKNINVDFGPSTSTDGVDSESYDGWASIDTVLPIITVQGIDVQWFSNLGIPLAGTTLNHDATAGASETTGGADTHFAFRKRFVADTVAEHIIMTAYGPVYFPNLAEGNATDPAQTTVRIEPTQNATGDTPLVFDTSAAINTL